jgi:hypothetical protein
VRIICLCYQGGQLLRVAQHDNNALDLRVDQTGNIVVVLSRVTRGFDNRNFATRFDHISLYGIDDHSVVVVDDLACSEANGESSRQGAQDLGIQLGGYRRRAGSLRRAKRMQPKYRSTTCCPSQ